MRLAGGGQLGTGRRNLVPSYPPVNTARDKSVTHRTNPMRLRCRGATLRPETADDWCTSPDGAVLNRTTSQPTQVRSGAVGYTPARRCD